MKLVKTLHTALALLLAVAVALACVPATQALAEGDLELGDGEGIVLEEPAGTEEEVAPEPALDDVAAFEGEPEPEEELVLEGEEEPELAEEPAGAETTEGVTKGAKTPNVLYRVHRQTYGWETGWKRNGQQSGTTGQSKRLEGICIKLSNKPVSGGVTYRTHVQKIGWQGWRSDGAMSGTSGKSLRLEAIQIKLTGNMASRYDVWYRVHAQRFGWMGWAKNGASSGTAGYAYRLEAIQVKLVRKGGSAPGSTSGAFREQKKPAVSTKYVGTYKREVYTASGTSSYGGYLPAGSLYSTRMLKIKSISGNKVKFKITYGNANMATAHGTNWITATIKNSRANFEYTSDENYGYEYGSGYLKFTNGKVVMSVTSDYYQMGMRYTLDTNGPMTMKKGTQRFYS